MNYSRVFIDAIGYELPAEVVTTQELEARLRPVYQALRLAEGQLEALTGIAERRWWEPGCSGWCARFWQRYQLWRSIIPSRNGQRPSLSQRQGFTSSTEASGPMESRQEKDCRLIKRLRAQN